MDLDTIDEDDEEYRQEEGIKDEFSSGDSEYSANTMHKNIQVEQAFAKRSRNMKATKKKKPVANGVGVAQARVGIGEQARTLMERRRRWNETIGPVFDKDLTRLPERSIFENLTELVEREKVGTVDDE
jgi:transcriptional adapter 3